MSDRYSVTRRGILAGIACAFAPGVGIAQTEHATPDASPESLSRPAHIDLGMGITISDYKVIQATEPSHFLLEIQSYSDEVVRAPTIGAIFPSAAVENGYAWAEPWHPLLIPGSSTFAIGLLPESGTFPSDTSWMICTNDLEITDADRDFLTREWKIDSSIEILSPTALRISSQVTNTGSQPIRLGELRGIVRDSSGRLCGGIPPSNPLFIAPGETVNRRIGFNATWQSPANPFHHCEDASEFRISLDIQPRGPAVSPGCPAVMPWNR